MALQVGAALILLSRRLAATHSALVGYLVFGALMSALLSRLDTASGEYLRLWAFALPISTALSIAMGLQAYGRSLETSPRARRASHALLLLTCGVAAGVAQLAQETFTPYGVLSRIHHGVSIALGLFCIVMLPLLQHFYSPRRRRNAAVQEWVLTCHYAGNALMLLATHWQLYPFNQYLNFGTGVLCCLAWATLLREEGEYLPPATGDATGSRMAKLEAEAQFDTLAAKVKSAARSR